jgi:hypothetical protein
MLNNIFNSSMISKSLEVAARTYLLTKNDLNFTHWLSVIFSLVKENPFVILILLIPYAVKNSISNNQKELSKNLMFYGISFTVTICLFVFSVGSFWMWRHSGAMPVVANFIGIICLFIILKNYIRIAQFICILLIMVPIYKILFSTQNNFRNIFIPALAVRSHTGGEAKAWLRLNLKPEESFLIPYDPQIYYLMGTSFRILEHDPVLDTKTYDSSSTHEICDQIAELKLNYLLDSTSPMPWGKKLAIFYESIYKYPQTIIFNGKKSKIINLQLLCKLAENDKPSSRKLVPIIWH